MALVASQVPEQRLGYALGWLSTGQLVGSLIGPVIGGVLADVTGSYRMPFYCTSAICFVAVGLVWAFVHEQFVPPRRAGASGDPWRSLALLIAPAGLLPLFFVLLHGAVRHAHGAAGGDAVRAGIGRQRGQTSRRWAASRSRSPGWPT